MKSMKLILDLSKILKSNRVIVGSHVAVNEHLVSTQQKSDPSTNIGLHLTNGSSKSCLTVLLVS